VPVEVRSAVIPPDRSSFTQRPFHLIHRLVRGRLRLQVGVLLGIAYRPTGRHQPLDELSSLRVAQSWVCHPPEPTADHEIAPIRRHGVLHGRQADFRCGLADGFFAATSFAGFLPAIGISISF
jgi:hypothetical protein